MRIAEIFHSIQGEGSLTGVPSVFVRAAGCNLRCAWCDTPHASWHPEGREMRTDQIAAEVRRLGARHVVLTGGEPMIARDIHALARTLRDDGRHITIETAATVLPGGIACDLASLSPKLRNSTPAAESFGDDWRERHERLRFQPDVIRAWLTRADGDYQLKFVVCTPADLAEIDAMLLAIATPVPPAKIFLMPEGVTLEALRARSSWLVAACRDRGFRYAHRLHIELFGHTRGT